MSDNNTESSPIMKAAEGNVDDVSEVHVLTQEEVNEQIRSHIAPLTRQPDEMKRGDVTAQHPASYPRAGTIGSFGTAGYQCNSGRKVVKVRAISTNKTWLEFVAFS